MLNQYDKLCTTHRIDANAEPPKFNSVMSSFGTEFDYSVNQFYFLCCFYNGRTMFIKSYLHFQIGNLKAVRNKFLLKLVDFIVDWQWPERTEF